MTRPASAATSRRGLYDRAFWDNLDDGIAPVPSLQSPSDGGFRLVSADTGGQRRPSRAARHVLARGGVWTIVERDDLPDGDLGWTASLGRLFHRVTRRRDGRVECLCLCPGSCTIVQALREAGYFPDTSPPATDGGEGGPQ